MKLLQILKDVNVITQKDQINKQVRVILDKHPEILNLLMNETKFLSEESTLRERVHCVRFNITTQPVCKTCHKPVTFNRGKGKYNTHCQNVFGKSCASKDTKLQEKRINTIKNRLGVDNPSKSKIIRRKVVKTNLEKYGGVAPACDESIKAKIRETKSFRYKTYREITKKIQKTNMEKYGAKTYAESLLPSKSVKLLGDKHWLIQQYVFCNKSIKLIAQELNVGKYTIRKFLKKFNISKGILYEKIDTIIFSPTYYLSNKQWLIEYYQHRNISKTQIANMLGVNISYVHQWCLKHKIKKNPNIYSMSSSENEREIINFIREKNPKLYFETNTKKVIPPYEIDIFIPDANLAIEYNGTFWHSENNGGKERKYHLTKLNKCKEKNIHLIQIWSSEWYTRREIVQSRICSLLNLNTRIYARKCKIQEISPKEAHIFLEKTHIQGFQGGTIHIGLIHNTDIVAVMTFGKSRYNKKESIELLRYSNALYTNVIGGASKIFNYYISKCSPQEVISYSDKRWNTGKLYKVLGFKHIRTTLPNYFYFKSNGDSNKLYSRIMFQKHKLKTKLDKFDVNISEWENMQLNKYDRIWDCGNDVYIWSV